MAKNKKTLYDHDGDPLTADDLELCPQCKKQFPCELISPMFENGEYISCCPICALKRTREAHGIPNYMFTGSMAKTMYERAIAFLSQSSK
jgi:hypothetical protein